MTYELTLPGVYQEAVVRSADAMPRTDVAGFIGFERRVRDGSTPCGLTPISGPPIGHAFQVDVLACELRVPDTKRRLRVSATTDLVLSQAPLTIPLPAGGSICYAIIAVALGTTDDATLIVVPGVALATIYALPPDDDTVALVAAGAPFTRLVDVRIRRTPTGDAVFPTILPRDRVVRCEDWMDFQLKLGPLGDPDGTYLADAVQAFFLNGGRRCWVSTTLRPRMDAADDIGLAEAREELIGVAGDSERLASGLERLLMVFEVAIVDVPDLYARRAVPDPLTEPLPPLDVDACFRPCKVFIPPGTIATGQEEIDEPLFDDPDVLDLQRRMIVRIAPAAWRALLVLTAPVELDPLTGKFAGPTNPRALAWRSALTGAVDDETMACTAFYHPWLLGQTVVEGPIRELPPTGFAAGVIARRDLARGPHIAPANEVVRGIVQISRPIDDDTHAKLAATPVHINVIRPFPGYGIQIWGARTLSRHPTLKFLAARRCLSAIERRAYAALRALVFEPNTPALWFTVSQTITGILMPVFEIGALAGASAEEAFSVRCDASNNPADQIADGRLLCQVAVWLAPQTEVIVFRLRRDDAAVAIEEAA